MKKELQRTILGFFYLLIAVCSLESTAQNVFNGEGVNWVGQINGYSQPTNLTANDYRVMQYRRVSTASGNPTDGRGQWATTVNVQTSGGNVTPSNMPGGTGAGFLFTSGPNDTHYSNKWNFTGVGQAGLDAINVVDRNSSTDMGLNMSVVGRYTFIFKDNGYASNSSFYVGFTTNNPVSIAHNPATQLSLANAIGTVTATIGATPSTQEKFYVRYRTATNDFSATTNLVQASVSGTTITATIPAQSATTVYYYIFSSTRTLAQLNASSAGDIAMQSLRYADNTGLNYSYAVVAAPGQPSAITGNNVVCANSSQTYSVTNDAAATSYTWTLPNGWSGTSTTNSIAVTTGSVGGTISVIANNTSGSSASRGLTVAINAGTSITSGPSTNAQTVCGGSAVTPLLIVADGSSLTYQWFRNASNSNAGGTLIAGATAATFTPTGLGSFYYYCVIGGACAPTSVTSNVSGLISINGLPNDNASNAAYSGGWATGSNGGVGFSPWTITTTGTVSGTFIGNSDIGAASWGVYANSNSGVKAVRSFASAFSTGSNFSFAMDNGFIDNGSSVGVRLRNAAGNTLMEFRFVGGNSDYTTLDGTGTGSTGVSYTSTGLKNVTIAYTAANAYSLSITKGSVTSVLSGRTFATVSGGQIPAQIEFFNNNAGSGGDYDAFFNNLSIGYPKIFTQPATAAQAAVCQNSAATALSVVAYGDNLAYQWYSNATSSNSGGSLISGENSNTFSPPTTTVGTNYYYCVVSYVGTCVAPVNSAVSGPVTVIAATTYYADFDGDGFGNSLSSIQACNLPTDYVLNNSDCDDTAVFYSDLDDDGFGSDTMVACGGVTNSLDCDDSQLLYADSDSDGFGFGAPVACGVSNNTDCDDTNTAIYQNGLFYVDVDGDSYTVGNQVTVCYGATTPTGYSVTSLGTDCNDSNAAVNPGAAEIGYNLIDDDCDGSIDEGFPPIVTVPQGCNNTLAAIDSYIYANLVAGAQGYRWRVTTMSGPSAGQIQFLDTPLRAMRITQLVNYAFATAYKIEVGVYYAGFLQPYTATSCSISTPATPTQLIRCSGDTRITAMTDIIYANNIPFAAGYRFKITDPANPSNTQELFRATREFRMSLITNFSVLYNKVYNVQVSIRNTDGTYLPYLNTCEVTTPIFPTVGLQDSQCDTYAVPSNNTIIYADSYPGVIRYVFRLKGAGLPAAGVEVTKNLRTFTLSDFPTLQGGATYNVQVRLVFNLSDAAGSYGKTCSIVAPGSARAEVSAVKGVFSAVAYPNPFSENFSISLTTPRTEEVSVKVYDMTGRLLQALTTEASEMKSLQVGDNFPSGVYNIIVNQGTETKTLRVVKR